MKSIRHRVLLVLAGLEQLPTGVVRYNGVDIRNVSADQPNVQRGIVFGRDLTLFEGMVIVTTDPHVKAYVEKCVPLL